MWKSRDLSRRSDLSASRGVELDDGQQRTRTRGPSRTENKYSGAEVLPVSRPSLSLSSIDLVDEPDRGDKGIECQVLARRFARLTFARDRRS